LLNIIKSGVSRRKTDMSDEILEEKQGSGIGKWVLIGVGFLIVIGASVGGTLYFVGMPTEQPQEPVEQKPPEPIYKKLHPAFIVSFPTPGRNRLLQTEITLRARDDETMAAVEEHDPLIRGRIINVLTDQDARELQTSEGKRVLRQQLLEAINQVLQEEGVPTRVEHVLFTSFIIQ